MEAHLCNKIQQRSVGVVWSARLKKETKGMS